MISKVYRLNKGDSKLQIKPVIIIAHGENLINQIKF